MKSRYWRRGGGKSPPRLQVINRGDEVEVLAPRNVLFDVEFFGQVSELLAALAVPVGLAENPYRTRRRRPDQVEDQLDQGRLAGAVDAGDRIILPLLDREFQRLEDVETRDRVTDIGNRKHVIHGPRFCA